MNIRNLSMFNEKSWKVDTSIAYSMLYKCENYILNKGFSYFLAYPYHYNSILRKIEKSSTVYAKVHADFNKNPERAIFYPAYSRTYKQNYRIVVCAKSHFLNKFEEGLSWLKKHPQALVSSDGILLEPTLLPSKTDGRLEVLFDDLSFSIEFKLNWL